MNNSNINVALLFGLFSPNRKDSIVSHSRGVIQNAADALQKCFVEGLAEHFKNIDIINLPFIGSYPSLYDTINFDGSEFIYTTGNGIEIKGKDISFCNVVGIKNFSRLINAKKQIIQWYRQREGAKIIVIYAIHTPFLKACVDLKQSKCPDLKIILIVPDLPEYMDSKKVWYRQFFQDINHRVQQNLYKEIDGFILLSKYMTERLPVVNKHWDVIEGMFNNTRIVNTISNCDDKYILYTGTLAMRYGILNLVHAFHNTKNQKYKLMICGAGDAEAEIKKIATLDKRIIFKGQLTREEVMKLQERATLLINPRTPEGEFTKYSFPSKTMEYMASGTPCILYRLPGIPDEYYNYCFTIDELGVDYLSSKLEEVMQIPITQLCEVGKRAQEFVFEFKNPKIQTAKLAKLINRIV